MGLVVRTACVLCAHAVNPTRRENHSKPPTTFVQQGKQEQQVDYFVMRYAHGHALYSCWALTVYLGSNNTSDRDPPTKQVGMVPL